MKFQVYADPGHAWAKVHKKTLTKLGIADKITHCSYQRGDFAYLEEDQDANTLVEALEARGIKAEFITHTANKQSRIRNYDSYCYSSNN